MVTYTLPVDSAVYIYSANAKFGTWGTNPVPWTFTDADIINSEPYEGIEAIRLYTVQKAEITFSCVSTQLADEQHKYQKTK